MEQSGPRGSGEPFIPEKGEGSRVLLQSQQYQLLSLFQGKLYIKSAQGYTEQQAPVFMVIPPEQRIHVRLSKESVFFKLTLEPWFFVEYRSRYWERDFLFFFKEELTFFPFLPDEQRVVQRIMDEIWVEETDKRPGYQELIRLKLSELFIALARIKIKTEPVVDVSITARGIREVIRYLEDHYTETITLNDVADYAGFSPSYLSRYFKSSTGYGLFAYINRIRIQKACKLLKYTNKTILDIAFEIGYNNVSFFNRCFKKIMKMSPIEFRRGF